jgi:Trp operon repressor
MVQISRNKLPDEIVAKLFLLFFETVGNKNNSKEFQIVINDLFSTTEQTMIIKRVAIIYLLLKGIEIRIIAETLKVSPATVCKFSLLTKKSDGIINYLNKILKKQKISEFFEDILYELFSRPGTYGINWSSAWKEKFKRDERKRTGL